MNFSKEQIDKMKFIYNKQVEINSDIKQKDKWSFVWTMGTDYFTHIIRINNFYYEILDKLNIDIENEEIFIEWKTSDATKSTETGVKKRYYFNLYKIVFHKKEYVPSP